MLILIEEHVAEPVCIGEPVAQSKNGKYNETDNDWFAHNVAKIINPNENRNSITAFQ